MGITPLTDKINLLLGAIAAFLAYVFGEHWVLFTIFLFLNVADFVTRWIAARLTKTENSKAGSIGIIKKLGYWIIIALGYLMGVVFMEVGYLFGIDLSVSSYIGLFVLATMIINEFRSILENLVDAGYKPPAILVKGLEIANKTIDDKIKMSEDEMDAVLDDEDD